MTTRPCLLAGFRVCPADHWVSWFNREASDGNHGQFVRDMTFVSITDVQLPFVFNGVRVAEVSVCGRNAWAFGEDGVANKEDFAKDRFARFADSNGKR